MRHALRMSEADMQGTIVEAAALAGWRVFHPYDSRRSTAGWPDLVLVRNTKAIFAELKTETGLPTTEQKGWLDALTMAGLDARLLRPADLDAFLGELTRRPA